MPEVADHVVRGISLRGKAARSPAALQGILAASLVVLATFAVQPSEAADAARVKIAVFDFELEDKSAGGGIIEPDPIDRENLTASTEEARRMLSDSGRYSLVDTSGVEEELASAGGVQHCNRCDGPLARKLGADQSMIGIITRVTRTEYTLQIAVRDARSGELLTNAFTGLRMGANYSWPRGVKWLMKNRVLAAPRAE